MRITLTIAAFLCCLNSWAVETEEILHGYQFLVGTNVVTIQSERVSEFRYTASTWDPERQAKKELYSLRYPFETNTILASFAYIKEAETNAIFDFTARIYSEYVPNPKYTKEHLFEGPCFVTTGRENDAHIFQTNLSADLNWTLKLNVIEAEAGKFLVSPLIIQNNQPFPVHYYGYLALFDDDQLIATAHKGSPITPLSPGKSIAYTGSMTVPPHEFDKINRFALRIYESDQPYKKWKR